MSDSVSVRAEREKRDGREKSAVKQDEHYHRSISKSEEKWSSVIRMEARMRGL